MQRQPRTKTIPVNYDELMLVVDGLSLAKVTNSVGDPIDKNQAKRLLVAVTTLLKLYRQEKPNEAAEKIIINKLLVG